MASICQCTELRCCRSPSLSGAQASREAASCEGVCSSQLGQHLSQLGLTDLAGPRQGWVWTRSTWRLLLLNGWHGKYLLQNSYMQKYLSHWTSSIQKSHSRFLTSHGHFAVAADEIPLSLFCFWEHCFISTSPWMGLGFTKRWFQCIMGQGDARKICCRSRHQCHTSQVCNNLGAWEYWAKAPACSSRPFSTHPNKKLSLDRGV